jgi:hypothetical protein
LGFPGVMIEGLDGLSVMATHSPVHRGNCGPWIFFYSAQVPVAMESDQPEFNFHKQVYCDCDGN